MNNLIDYILDLFFKNHQFRSHKLQDHWRLTWSLTLWPVRLVEVSANYPGHPR
jgi:hypothetical protein